MEAVQVDIIPTFLHTRRHRGYGMYAFDFKLHRSHTEEIFLFVSKLGGQDCSYHDWLRCMISVCTNYW